MQHTSPFGINKSLKNDRSMYEMSSDSEGEGSSYRQKIRDKKNKSPFNQIEQQSTSLIGLKHRTIEDGIFNQNDLKFMSQLRSNTQFNTQNI
eukprot:403375130